MQIRITRLDESVQLPRYETPGSVAFDIRARGGVEIPARAFAKIPTGLIIAVPEGHALIISSRSSTPERKGIQLPHGIGIIDQDYSGPEDELKILVHNFTDAAVTIDAGERIAQGMMIPIVRAEWIESPPGGKSRGGFGSTGIL